MILDKLYKKNLINPPKWLLSGVQGVYNTGSHSYGCHHEDSDMDIRGFCIPKKEILFPHTAGFIPNFGSQGERFEQWEEHHVIDDDCREYDIAVYNIVKFFHLCMNCSPDVFEYLYVPVNCIMHQTELAKMVRDKRELFLCKRIYHSTTGYAFSQLSKALKSDAEPGSKRYEDIKRVGWDTKFLYHCYRLCDQCEQLLTEGDMNLQRSKEVLKAIRRAEMTYEEVKEWFTSKEKHLRKLYENSKLPDRPREAEIKQLLLDCLEHHYGNLSSVVVRPDDINVKMLKIQKLAEEIQKLSGE